MTLRATGIVRRIDELGRFVIPMELRRTKGLDVGDGLEIFTDEGGNIVLKKYQPGCALCTNIDDLVQVKGIYLCPDCIKEIKKVAKKGA